MNSHLAWALWYWYPSEFMKRLVVYLAWCHPCMHSLPLLRWYLQVWSVYNLMEHWQSWTATFMKEANHIQLLEGPVTCTHFSFELVGIQPLLMSSKGKHDFPGVQISFWPHSYTKSRLLKRHRRYTERHSKSKWSNLSSEVQNCLGTHYSKMCSLHACIFHQQVKICHSSEYPSMYI